jgi:AraC family transcriptional regulator of adaptative response / DNA-3-methyladenine glycosylase II
MAGRTATLTVRLPYRRPFNWPLLLEFFAARATPGIEAVNGNTYMRTVVSNDDHGVVEIRPDQRDGYLSLTLHCVNTNALFETVQTAREVFDLDAPISEIRATLGKDDSLRAMLRKNPGVRVPGAWDGFEITIRAILGQQISVKAATTIAGRIAKKYGEPLDLSGTIIDGGLSHLFPDAARLMRARLQNIGLVRSRAETIRRVAAAVVAGDLDFDVAQDPEQFCDTLTSIKGVGDWTAQYVAMRALKNPDAFPGADLGLLKALTHPDRVTPKELTARAEDWRPWRAYAAMLLWGSLAGSGG